MQNFAKQVTFETSKQLDCEKFSDFVSRSCFLSFGFFFAAQTQAKVVQCKWCSVCRTKTFLPSDIGCPSEFLPRRLLNFLTGFKKKCIPAGIACFILKLYGLCYCIVCLFCYCSVNTALFGRIIIASPFLVCCVGQSFPT